MRRFIVFALMCMLTVAVYAFVPDNHTPSKSAGPITIITPDPESLFIEEYRAEQVIGLSEQEIREITNALDLGENVELVEPEAADDADSVARIEPIDDTDALTEVETVEDADALVETKSVEDSAADTVDDTDALAEIEAVEQQLAAEADSSQQQEVTSSTPSSSEQQRMPADTDAGMQTVTGRVDSSIYSTALNAGLSPNQVARLTRLLKPHLDFSRELRKGDELTVQLDPETSEDREDASRLYRIEFNGVRKHLLITRSDEDPEYYEVRDDSGKLLKSGSPVAKAQVKSKPEKEPVRSKQDADKKPVRTAAKTAGKTKAKEKGRLEATVDYSLFTAAREAGLTTSQTVELRSILDPYIDYNKELRKGDRLVINLDKSGSSIDSIEYDGKKKKLLAVREENGDFAVTDRTSGTVKVARKKTDKSPVAKTEKRSSKRTAPMISGWKPRDKALARVYARLLQSGKVSKPALQKAFKYYENNRYSRKLSDRHMAIADYTQTALARRLHIIDLKAGNVKSYQVAHGRRSGPVGGRVHTVSNVVGSNKTSQGFFKVGFNEGRTRTKGYPYLPIEGLESANRKVGLPTRLGGRDVIVHTASYVESGGRSNGCFAIRPQDRRQVFGKLKGALLLSYAG